MASEKVRLSETVQVTWPASGWPLQLISRTWHVKLRRALIIAFDIAEIINKFDRKLFSQIIHPGRCLYHLLPPKTPAHCRYSLRERQHSFQLSNIEFLQFKNSFINRCLFKFRRLHSALQSDVFSEFCTYCSYCSSNFTFYFV